MPPSDLKLSPHFWLSEFTQSQTAARLHINNDPPEPAIANLRQLATLLEAARVLLGGKPILISSGYRSGELNVLVGGASRSAHLTGRAADFTCPAYGSPREVVARLSDAGLPFDKAILEGVTKNRRNGAWCHLQIQKPGAEPRREVLTAVFDRPTVTYMRGLYAG